MHFGYITTKTGEIMEIPVFIGATVCRFFSNGPHEEPHIRSSIIKSITINKKGIKVEFQDTFYSGYVDDDFSFLTQEDLEKDKFVFTDATYYVCAPEVAEAKLAKLKGGAE